MARILLLDRAQYRDGLIALRRGDAWTLNARVVDRIGSVDTDFDLTGCPASAFFEADSGDVDGLIPGVVTLDDGTTGKLTVSLTDAETPLVAEATEGVSMYVVVDHPTLGLITMETPDAPLEIKDRGFSQF